MKTQALTPCIQNFCSAMDAKLSIRLEDLQHYLPSDDTGKGTHFPSILQFLYYTVKNLGLDVVLCRDNSMINVQCNYFNFY